MCNDLDVCIIGMILVVLYVVLCFFFFKQKTAYEMRISDWSSDVCSSDLLSLLLFYGLSLTRNLSVAPGADEMRVRVTGEMWWWRVAYLDDNGGEVVLDANELHIPVGEPDRKSTRLNSSH